MAAKNAVVWTDEDGLNAAGNAKDDFYFKILFMSMRFVGKELYRLNPQLKNISIEVRY